MRLELAQGAPEPSARIIVERPPPGLAQGRYAAPPWAIGLVGGLAFIIGLVYLVLRARQRLRR
jgi:hypothetical protein